MTETLFEYALCLHRQHPDNPLPNDGEPFPDGLRWRHAPGAEHRRQEGMAVAAILDTHFADLEALPERLLGIFHDVKVLIHPNDHIRVAALRADENRVRETGRYLVRRGTDRYTVAVGLALLATGWDARDAPLIQTIGLLSETFGPLAAEGLKRRPGSLLWLARRTAGWGRVHLVRALCPRNPTAEERAWLLRESCTNDYLDYYFAAEVATSAHLLAAMINPDADDALIDHTGLLLRTMATNDMGVTLDDFPPAPLVIDAYLGHIAAREPSLRRYLDAGILAAYVPQRERIVALLKSAPWKELGGDVPDWFARNVAAESGL